MTRPAILTGISDRGTATRLLQIAKTYVWWKPPEQTLQDLDLFIVQLMAYGASDDVLWTLDILGPGVFKHALRHSPPGIFDKRSWTFWHTKLNVEPIPGLPGEPFHRK